MKNEIIINKVKIPLTARSLALKIISAVFIDGAYANIALGRELSKSELSDYDRRFATELVYGTVKAKGTIDWILEQLSSRPLAKIEPYVLNCLRMGIFQIFFADKIPDSAACNESVKIIKSYMHEGVAKFTNGILRSAVRAKENKAIVYPEVKDDAKAYLSLKEFHPDWLVKRWIKQFGFDDAEKICQYNNLPPNVTMRVNTLVTDRDTLLKKLAEAGFEAEKSKWSEDGIVCSKTTSLTAFLKDNFNAFYMQDESSMLVAGILAPQPGETVIDMCAAPGGKTTHIAQLMGNKGQVYACDIHEHKLGLISENAKRLKIDIIEPMLKDATEFCPEWEGKADKVLVDAPCSGIGVLRRRAEARWRKTKKDLKVFPPLQTEILQNASRYVKPGGKLVYSTCTLEQAENHYIPAAFLENNPEWEYGEFKHPLTGESINELQILPQRDGIDGFYICVLQRKE